MKKTALLIEELDASIIQIEKDNLSNFNSLNKKIKASNYCLSKFRNVLRKDDFSSKKEEIYFFKFQKPYIQGRCVHYRKVKKTIY